MTIEEALILLEDQYIEKDIKALSPKDRLNFWSQLKEFAVPKIQRTLFEPLKSNELEIKIKYENDSTNPHQGI